MDFICSEEVIELGTDFFVIYMCSGMVFFLTEVFFFFDQIKWRFGDRRKANGDCVRIAPLITYFFLI